jgi:DNA-binding transcriptional ArsR family regulator
VLREARLVTVRVDGRRRWYGADHEALAEVRTFFDEYWSAAVDRLADAAERATAARRDAS